MWRLVLLSGCLIGGGPTLAVRSSGRFAAGWQADTMVGPLGLAGGQSYGRDGNASYIGVIGARYGLNSGHGGDENYFPTSRDAGVTAMIGVGGAGDGATAIAGVAPMGYAVAGGSCRDTRTMYSLEVGVRWVGVFEVYAAPKIRAYLTPCF